jgi:hypothetical protein
MRLNITEYFNSELHYDVSCSRATHGAFAGERSYTLACDSSTEFLLLDTKEKQIAAIDYFEGFGAWEVEEMEAWSVAELNGLLLQFISGDYNEASEYQLIGGFDWAGYESDDQLSSNMYKGSDNEIYYLID